MPTGAPPRIFLQYLHLHLRQEDTRIRDASSQQQRRRRCGGHDEDGDFRYATMVSWGQRVTSEDRYITVVSTVLVTAATYLGFEYESVHDGDRKGFTVKPTAKNVDECLDFVQLHHVEAVMTPLTEQKCLNLHDETTACDQIQYSLFRAVVEELQYITGVRPDVMFATKYLSYKLAAPTLADLTRAKKVLIPALKPHDLNKTLKHITGFQTLTGLVIQ